MDEGARRRSDSKLSQMFSKAKLKASISAFLDDPAVLCPRTLGPGRQGDEELLIPVISHTCEVDVHTDKHSISP